MDTLGRKPQPREFNARLAAKLLAWLGAVVLVVGSIAVIFLAFSSGNEGQGFSFFGDTAEGRVYLLVTLWPQLLMTVGVLWAVAAFLWSRNERNAS